MAPQRRISPFYRLIRGMVRLFYPKICVIGAENLPDEGAVIVGNHSQMHGPIACELYFPGRHWTWCAGEMMHLREVPAYAYRDFWSQKPKLTRPFYRLLSYLIAPLSVCVFNNANCIGVYHSTKIISAYRASMDRLNEGARIIIFPERDQPYNHILSGFQTGFVDLARLYWRRTRQALCFVPMYLAPALKTMYIGTPVRYDPENDTETERARICAAMAQAITELALTLPRHTVVPYRNIPKRDYPTNV